MTKEPPERLQKVISMRGYASRREAEKLIQEGKVRVNGKTVTELGTKVSANDRIEIAGVRLESAPTPIYVILYKPVRVLTTTVDPHGRSTVFDYLSTLQTRVFPVGRLDYDTSGLLLLTNDGELAHRLMHPRFGMWKTYEALAEGAITNEEVDRLRKGVVIAGRKTAPAEVRILGSDGNTSKLEIRIHEGRNRQIRKMLEAVDHPCLKLVRTKYGSLNLHGLRPGEWRYLKGFEIERLKMAANPSKYRS